MKFTHTGVISNKAGTEKVKLYEKPLVWVSIANRLYYKDSGLRVGGKGPRLDIGSIKEL